MLNIQFGSFGNLLVFKGSISVAGDFPTLAQVESGWFYTVLAGVTDNDVTKTNTGVHFFIGKIVWNGSGWDVVQDLLPRVDLCLSSDGGKTFGNYVSKQLNSIAERKNILRFWNLGRHNELALQFRFYGYYKFIVGDGEANVFI